MNIFKKYKLVWIGVVIVSLLLTTGTMVFVKEIKDGKIKSGFYSALLMSGTSYPGKVSKKFKLLNGVQYNKIKLDAGESITIKYESNIESGELEVLFIDENDNIIKSLFEDEKKGEYKFTSESKKKYYLKIISEDASGSFEITW